MFLTVRLSIKQRATYDYRKKIHTCIIVCVLHKSQSFAVLNGYRGPLSFYSEKKKIAMNNQTSKIYVYVCCSVLLKTIC